MLRTRSGRVYILQGYSDYDDNAQYVLGQHLGRAAGKVIDVSTEYFGDASLIKQEQPTSLDKNSSLGSITSFSHAESSRLQSKSGLPFQPNERLAKALKTERKS